MKCLCGRHRDVTGRDEIRKNTRHLELSRESLASGGYQNVAKCARPRTAGFGISCAYVVFSGEPRVESRIMSTFPRRLVGAATLDARTYEEVEADRPASAQAAAVVLLASIAGGIGLLGAGVPTLASVIAGVVGSLLGWISWAVLIFFIGTRLLPEPQTKADVGELLRTIAFASSPGLLRVFGFVPVVGPSI